MATFAPLLADSLEGLNKTFLSFLMNKGFQACGLIKGGIKGIKGGKHLSHLLSLYSGLVCGWVFVRRMNAGRVMVCCGSLPSLSPAGNSNRDLSLLTDFT
jgi:hypothetical protein